MAPRVVTRRGGRITTDVADGQPRRKPGGGEEQGAVDAVVGHDVTSSSERPSLLWSVPSGLPPPGAGEGISWRLAVLAVCCRRRT